MSFSHVVKAKLLGNFRVDVCVNLLGSLLTDHFAGSQKPFLFDRYIHSTGLDGEHFVYFFLSFCIH